MILLDRHRQELETESAILPEIIRERGYFSASGPADLPDMFADYQRRPGLVIPIRDTTGDLVAHQLKPDSPRMNKDGKAIKYDTAAKGRQCLDVPIRSRTWIGDPSVPLFITEGEKKVDSGL
jgi:hypothetical protein